MLDQFEREETCRILNETGIQVIRHGEGKAVKISAKKTMASPESLAMDLKMGELSALFPGAPKPSSAKGQ